MAEITSTDGRAVVDYRVRDYESFLASMLQQVPTKLPEWKDFQSEADFGRVLLELFAHMGDVLSYYQDRVANESFLGTAQTRRSIIHHLRLIGYRLSTAAPASASLTLSVPAAVTDVVEVARGAAFATRSQKDRPAVRFEYALEEPLSLDFGAVPVDPATGRKLFAPVPVEEGRLIRDEVLGESDGTPDQTFRLGHSGLILRSRAAGAQLNRDLIVVTELGGTPTEWALRDTLAFSRAEQHDVVVEIDDEDRATLRFGDGALGAVPAAGSEVRATYRVGGGSRGNVPPDSIATIVDAPQLALLGARVTHAAGATGGADRETVEHAVEHAPSVFRSHQRAVTAEDYRALALDFAGVGKVRAESTSWNVVTLYVAPEGGGQVSDVLEANLLAYFEDKRPLSTILEVDDVDYVDVYVRAEVGVKSYYSRADIEAEVRARAGGLLAFEAVDFGRTLYLSKVYEEIERIEGVAFVNVTEFRRQDDPPATVVASGKVEMKPSELPRPPADPAYADGIRVDPAGGF